MNNQFNKNKIDFDQRLINLCGKHTHLFFAENADVVNRMASIKPAKWLEIFETHRLFLSVSLTDWIECVNLANHMHSSGLINRLKQNKLYVKHSVFLQQQHKRQCVYDNNRDVKRPISSANNTSSRPSISNSSSTSSQLDSTLRELTLHLKQQSNHQRKALAALKTKLNKQNSKIDSMFSADDFSHINPSIGSQQAVAQAQMSVDQMPQPMPPINHQQYTNEQVQQPQPPISNQQYTN